MLVFPNIKINLGLSITGRRPDGYHNIETAMVPVPRHEVIELTLPGETPPAETVMAVVKDPGVTFYQMGQPIPGDAGTNLCLRVVRAVKQWYHLPPFELRLLKTNPLGAGLGSGSADAAFTLRALVGFFDLRISDSEAQAILAEIGSDCAFFWKNQCAFAFGKGEQLRPLALDVSGFYIAVVHPRFGISTAEAYASVVPKPPVFDLEMLPSLPVEAWPQAVVNDFEAALFPRYPVLASIKDELYHRGAFYASLSGSGSAVYGLFHTEPDLKPVFPEYDVWQGSLQGTNS